MVTSNGQLTTTQRNYVEWDLKKLIILFSTIRNLRELHLVMDQLIRLYKRVLMFMQMEGAKLEESIVTSEKLIEVVCAPLPSNMRQPIQPRQSLPKNSVAATSVLSVIKLWD
uniref:Uncharacterized protein n=1 Tax=Oryza barthii TaxID=65489 RepID=A0A0D3G7B7_9ORYZ